MLEKLKEAIAVVVPGVELDDINENTKFTDELDFDSLSMMMLSMEIEARLGYKFTEFVKFETVGELCTYLEERLEGACRV